jgi:hypothetical protein
MIKVRISRAQGHPTDMVHAGGKYGTVLQAASYGGNLQVVQLLLDKGADPNTQGVSLAISKRCN